MVPKWTHPKLPQSSINMCLFQSIESFLYSCFNHETNQDQNHSTSIFDRIINYYSIEFTEAKSFSIKNTHTTTTKREKKEKRKMLKANEVL